MLSYIVYTLTLASNTYPYLFYAGTSLSQWVFLWFTVGAVRNSGTSIYMLKSVHRLGKLSSCITMTNKCSNSQLTGDKSVVYSSSCIFNSIKGEVYGIQLRSWVARASDACGAIAYWECSACYHQSFIRSYSRWTGYQWVITELRGAEIVAQGDVLMVLKEYGRISWLSWRSLVTLNTVSVLIGILSRSHGSRSLSLQYRRRGRGCLLIGGGLVIAA